jgi:hypothetical protein
MVRSVKLAAGSNVIKTIPHLHKCLWKALDARSEWNSVQSSRSRCDVGNDVSYGEVLKGAERMRFISLEQSREERPECVPREISCGRSPSHQCVAIRLANYEQHEILTYRSYTSSRRNRTFDTLHRSKCKLQSS